MTSPGGHRASLAEPEGRRRSPAGRCSDPLGGVTTAGPFSTYPTTLPSPAGPFSRKENETYHAFFRYLLKAWNRTCIELQLFLFVDILWFLQAIACSDQAVTCMLCRFFCYMDIWHVTTLLEHVWDNGNMCMLLCAYMSMRIGFGWRLDLTVGIGCLRCGCRLSYYVSI